MFYCAVSNRLFVQLLDFTYGPTRDPADVTASLKEMVECYNTSSAENAENAENESAAVRTTSSGRRLVAVCSPLMRRVHEHVSHSGELCFIDSTGGMDRQDSRVFVLLTHSPAGALPLGLIITESEEEQVIFEGLELLKTLLGPEAFYHRGNNGPAVFLTDDSTAERNALKTSFPRAERILCTFHVLHALWRWLQANVTTQQARASVLEPGVDAKTMARSDRATFCALVRDMLYAESDQCLERLYTTALTSDAVKRFVYFFCFVYILCHIIYCNLL